MRDFFKKWSNDMSYVLGFFAADGSMYINRRGSHYIAFYSNDLEIIEKIRKAMNATQKITQRRISDHSNNLRYHIQIGSQEMFQDMLNLGMKPNKSLDLNFPNIPPEHLGSFVRGYFDGDGHIVSAAYTKKGRKSSYQYLAGRFTSGSKNFLVQLRSKLTEHAQMGPGSLFRGTRSYVLSYGKRDSKKLFDFMYNNAINGLLLERKYRIFQEGISLEER